MRLVDLSHPVTIHSPGWVGYPGMKMWYFQTHQTNGIVSQMIETPLHLSTHLDSEMHGVSGGRDIASVSLDQCVGRPPLSTSARWASGASIHPSWSRARWRYGRG